MGPESDFIVKYAPYYIPIIAAFALILFTKTYLFRGMVDAKLYQEQIELEKRLIVVGEGIEVKLQGIVDQQAALLKKVSEEIGSNTERLRSVEMAMSDYLDQFRELNYQFEKHRKNIPDTEVFKRGKGKDAQT